LHPLIHPGFPEHIKDLVSSGAYIAGTLDADFAHNQEDLYDVLVNTVDKSILISPQAAADLRMGSIHKEMSDIMTRVCSAPQVTDVDVINAIATQTQRVLEYIRNLARGGIVTRDVIVKNVSNQARRRWLLEIAQLEGMIQEET